MACMYDPAAAGRQFSWVVINTVASRGGIQSQRRIYAQQCCRLRSLALCPWQMSGDESHLYLRLRTIRGQMMGGCRAPGRFLEATAEPS